MGWSEQLNTVTDESVLFRKTADLCGARAHFGVREETGDLTPA